jgi:hypothetical protein
MEHEDIIFFFCFWPFVNPQELLKVTATDCLNYKFPTHVELCWQNKNIPKLGIVIMKVGNIIIL